MSETNEPNDDSTEVDPNNEPEESDGLNLPQVECSYCGEMFSNRGITSHEQYCDENPENEMPAGGSQDSGPICPECGNRDDDNPPNIYYSNENLKRRLVDNGPLGEAKVNAIRNHEYLCGACANLFNGGSA